MNNSIATTRTAAAALGILWIGAALAACMAVWLPGVCLGGDWPQWRYDAGRGAASPDDLPEPLHLQWIRELPQPAPAWPPSQPWLQFDASYCPAAAGGLLFVPSTVTDSLTAYDSQTGQLKWQFYADGPVRFAPIARQGRVYFGSDDGYLYCLDAGRGTLLWRFRGGPSDRKVLGNQRLISTWPVRGGPVLHEGIVYFTAGIWPFMGIFVHAVDAQTGEAIWTNSGEGSTYTLQPHNSPAFSGFVPCGHLAATASGLIAPGGRTDPGCYDLKTGKLRYFQFGSKSGGSHHVTACDQWYFSSGQMIAVADGKPILETPAAVHDGQALYTIDHGEIFAQALQPQEQVITQPDRKGQDVTIRRLELKELWRAALPAGAPQRLFLKAGSRLIAGGRGVVAAVRVEPQQGRAELVWKGSFEGDPWTMLAADDRLFVVTTGGRVYCFGAAEREPTTYLAAKQPAADAASPGHAQSAGTASAILAQTGVQEGYAVLFGLGDPGLAEQLVCASKLHLIAVDRDAAKVDAARRRMDELGLYGRRFAAQVGDPVCFPWPPYLAGLAVVEPARATGGDGDARLVQAVFRVLRPYGGAALLQGLSPGTLRRLANQAGLAGAQVEPAGAASKLVRAGPLPGAADWTHQYADAANSVVSQDRLVKAPLGLLWFGGSSNDEVLPRHGHGPSPQVAAGRLLIEGPNMLRALDIYTGRLLWQKEFPGLGKYYDSILHQPGANEIGSNYVSLADCVYVVRGSAILELDAATGQQKKEFRLSAGPDGGTPNWGFLAACEDLLIAASTPVVLEAPKDTGETAGGETKPPPPPDQQRFKPVPYASASRRLVVFDRHTGQMLWDRQAKYSFRHNCIAVGAGRIFCIDGLSLSALALLKRRGEEAEAAEGRDGKPPEATPGKQTKVSPADSKKQRDSRAIAKKQAKKRRQQQEVSPKDLKNQPDYQPRLLALDARTGREVWSTTADVFGTFLGYSSQYDVLLQAGSAARDRADDEARAGMAAYRGADGTVLWKDLQRQYTGPCMLHHDTIITQGNAYELLTGRPKLREDPLTGRQMDWQFQRNYGCNTAIASEHLLTFRSAAAGYYDLTCDGGTGNLGGFKSGCTSNLIVAGGVLSAPDYTRTCTCRYQNQTSLALVHDPEAEMWTFNAFRWSGDRVRRVGINFGAPGDRLAQNGTLWLDYPSRGGPSPDIPVQVEPKQPEYFCHHSSRIRAVPGSLGLSWVAASGVKNVTGVTLTLGREQAPQPRPYTVRLHFAETEPLAPGQRIFKVRLQDRDAGPEIDLVQEAGRMTALVKEYKGVEVADKLRLTFQARGGQGSPGAVLCGIEVLAEGW